MKQWNVVIFDMDGTLFDTEMLSRLAWMEAGKKFHLPISEDFVLNLIGLTPSNAQTVYDQYMPEGWPQESAYQFHEEFMKEYRIEHGIPTKTDLHALLSTLKTRGYRLGLATSARHETMEFNLETADIRKYFDVALSAEMMEKGKPDPDIYFKTMQAMNVNPQECMIVEDSYNGVRSGYASGASVVMVPDLLQPTSEIKSMCHYILRDINDVLDLLK